MVGIAGIALILMLQRWLPKVPAVLIMVVLAIASTSVFSLADHGVSLVGTLPKGFPDARHLPGLVIYRFDAPLFFANAKNVPR